VDRSAPIEVVETAYRALAKKHHPDVDPSPMAAARMRELNRAYAIPSNSASSCRAFL
jgi:curved DNA-binding protein